MTTPIQVVGLGLEGAAGLSAAVQTLVGTAAVLVGGKRHLSYFPEFAGEIWPLDDLTAMLQRLEQWLQRPSPGRVVVLASGDPLFFGIGRLLLTALPPAAITFHPHLSSVQLAFSRIKQPWQGATLVSAHGRSDDSLVQALRRCDRWIAVLTDGTHTPTAIGRLVTALNLPCTYKLWICENLGGPDERVSALMAADLRDQAFALLSVVILEQLVPPSPDLRELPVLGLPDAALLSFEDRPGLMTKREVRLQVLGELALQPGQTVWDVGAGTGSVSVEIGRLCPTSQVYAIEKTAAGLSLIQQNLQRFGLTNVTPIGAAAPAALEPLPRPDRVFIGGSGGRLRAVLQMSAQRLVPQGRLVVALATLEHVSLVLQWLDELPPDESSPDKLSPDSGPPPGERPRLVAPGQAGQASFLQLQISRSAPVGPLTRWLPLNPVTILTWVKGRENPSPEPETAG